MFIKIAFNDRILKQGFFIRPSFLRIMVHGNDEEKESDKGISLYVIAVRLDLHVESFASEETIRLWNV